MSTQNFRAYQKEQTRERIIEAAAELFRTQGFQGAGVKAVMEEAGLTVGGFYAHFESKQALLEAAIEKTVRDTVAETSSFNHLKGKEWLSAFLDFYLSPQHRDNPDKGCCLPVLGAEVARMGPEVKELFQSLITRLCAAMEGKIARDSPQTAEETAWGVLALSVGALMLSRSLADARLSDEVLRMCRAFALRGSPGGSGPGDPPIDGDPRE